MIVKDEQDPIGLFYKTTNL